MLIKHVGKLLDLLQAAALPVESISDTGNFTQTRNFTEAEITIFNTIMLTHGDGSKYDYVEQRRRAYPLIGDQFDYIATILGEMKAGGVKIGATADEYLDQIAAVKTQFPKGV